MARINRISELVLLALACLTMLLFANLGLQARMVQDDYLVAAVGRETGAIGGLVHYYTRWTGGYSSIFLKTGLAPYAEALPPLVIMVFMLTWVLGLYWLFRQLFSRFRLEGSPGILALAASALVIGAAINAFYTPEPFYWYSANMQYTVPLAFLVVCFGLAYSTLRQADSKSRLRLGAAICGLICFLTAGAAEMYLVFQLTFLALLAALAFNVVERRHFRALATVAGAMLLATAIGAAAQLASPGIWRRMTYDAINFSPPIRSLSQLATMTIQIAFESIGRQEVVAGFTLLFGLGLLLGLRSRMPTAMPADFRSADGINRGAVFALAVQMVLLPIMLAHRSNEPWLFGRYSLSYSLVLGLNIFLLLMFLAASWQRKRIAAALAANEYGLRIVSAGLFLAFLCLVTLTQIRSTDSRAMTYLFASALSMLAALAMLWHAGDSGADARMISRVAIGSLVIAWITIAVLTFVTFVGHGFTSHRIMAGPAFLQVTAGLIWGFYLGYLFKSRASVAAHQRGWRRLVAVGSLALTLLIGGGIFLGQARLLPNMQTYAREWDARRDSIIAQRESGRERVKVAALTFDLADLIGMGSISYAHVYYNVDSITVVSPLDREGRLREVNQHPNATG